MGVWRTQVYFSLQITRLQNNEKNPSLVMLQMDGHAQIWRQRRGKEGRNSERVKWSSAVLPVQHCLFLGNLSIALCSKSHLLVFQFLIFYLLPCSNIRILCNLHV